MSKAEDYPEEFMELLNSVTGKRPATVINHILEHGYITTQELKDIYGYNHPPRAVRDVREQGIPIETFRVEGTDGRKIAAYRFGDPSEVNRSDKTKGRQNITKEMKDALIEKYGTRDFIYLENMPASELQVDHRIPYEIGGEAGDTVDDFMLLSPSANRLKSHACETCPNWKERNRKMCACCFWAYPERYSHVAGRHERIVLVSLSDEKEINGYDHMMDEYGQGETMQKISKAVYSCINTNDANLIADE